MTLKKTLSKLTKNNKIHKEGFEAGYDKGVKDTLTDLKDWIEAYLNTIK